MTADLDENAEDLRVAPALDLTPLLKDIPRGAWIALSRDHTHVVAFSADMRSAFEEAHDKGEEAPVMFRIPEQPSSLLL